MTFLERLMQARFPDARVYRNPHEDSWTVSIKVGDRDAIRARAGGDQVEVMRGLIGKLEPQRRPRRRLHWGKKR